MITKKTAAWKINAALRCILYFCRSRGLSCTLFFFLFFFFFFFLILVAVRYVRNTASYFCCAALYSALPYCSTALSCTVAFCITLYTALPYWSTALYCAVVYCALPCTVLSYWFVLYCSLLYHIIHCLVPHCRIALYCNVTDRTALYIALHRIVVYWEWMVCLILYRIALFVL